MGVCRPAFSVYDDAVRKECVDARLVRFQGDIPLEIAIIDPGQPPYNAIITTLLSILSSPR